MKLRHLKVDPFVKAVRENYDAMIAFADAQKIGFNTPETKASYWDNFRRKQAAEEILERFIRSGNYTGGMIDIETAKYVAELNNQQNQVKERR